MQGSSFPTLVHSLIALSAIIVTNCAFCQHIPTLTTDDGLVYRDVEIRRVTADGIAIIHSTGAATVKFDKLTKDVSSLPETIQTAAQNYLQRRTTKLREPQTAPSKNPSS